MLQVLPQKCYFCPKFKALQRYFLEIVFRGTNYHGWQRQLGSVTVQERMEYAVSTLLKSETACTGCGRTDTGVHASQFFLHFDAPEKLNAAKLVYRLNGLLENDIAVRRCIEVDSDAHARFDAIERTYRYFIHQQKDPFLNDRSTFVPFPLNVEAMNAAAVELTKMEDFKTFAKIHSDVKHHRCDLSRAVWQMSGHQLEFEITANRFLRNMVRAVVGTLLEVGQGKMSLEEFKTIAVSGDRSRAGKSVDSRGLFLCHIKYPFIQ